MEGTEHHPSQESLLRHTDDLYGTSLRTSASKRGDRHVIEAYVGVPDETALGDGAAGLFEQAVEALFEVVSHPATEDGHFVRRHVEREKGLHEHRIRSLFDDKIAYAAEQCMAKACAGHAAALPRLGYLNEVAALTPVAMWEIHQAVRTQSDVHVYVAGNIGDEAAIGERLLKRLMDTFPDTSNRHALAPVQPLTVSRGGEANRVIEEQSIQQGKLDIAYRTGVSVRDDDYPAMMVMNGILGGFVHSKLFRNVREKESLAYYCSSRFDDLTGVELIQTGIEVANFEKALRIIQEQVEALVQGDISEDELRFTKSSIRNVYTQLADYPMNVADVHFKGVLAGATRGVSTLLSEVEAVTASDVVRMAERLQLDTVYLLKNRPTCAPSPQQQ